MRYLIKPCLLIQVGLSSFIDNNQIYESDKVAVQFVEKPRGADAAGRDRAAGSGPILAGVD
ncbi:MAG: hypothetical protein WAV07_17625 [Candidatus Contendobacter sp.]